MLQKGIEEKKKDREELKGNIPKWIKGCEERDEEREGERERARES